MAKWVELATYARERGIPERTLRRRASALHAHQGDVLKSANESAACVRKWLINVEAFEPPALPQDPRITELHARLDRLESTDERLRAAIARLRWRLPT